MSFPGKRSMLKLKRRDLDAIYRYAEAEYPHECCGLLTDRSSGVASQLHPCRNIQDRLHAEDPEQYPRTSRIGYFLSIRSSSTQSSALRKGAVEGYPASIIPKSTARLISPSTRPSTVRGAKPSLYTFCRPLLSQRSGPSRIPSCRAS